MTKYKKEKKKFTVLDVIVCTLLVVYAIIIIAILLWGLLSSFKSFDDFTYNYNILGLPNPSAYGGKEALAFGNYKIVLFSSVFNFSATDASYFSTIFGYIKDCPDKIFGFGDFFLNSFIYSFVCSFVHSFVALTCAYLCAKYKFRFSGIIYVVMLIVMTVPIVGSYPSMLSLLRELGIYDTYFAMVALNFNFTGTYFFVFHAYMTGLSDTYIEAAEIDGASQLRVYLEIVFPLCLKIFATVFLLQFIMYWNDYQTPLLFYPNHPTLAYGVFKMTNNTNGSDKGMEYQGIPQKVAGCMVLALPVLILFIAFNRRLMGNLTMGGIKE